MNDNFDDIRELPHHTSKRHPRMAMLNRAAQFAPFAALTGHDDAIQETARETEVFDPDAANKNMLDKKLAWLIEYIDSKPNLSITYFQPDMKKDGGKHITINGCIKSIDETWGNITMADGLVIPLSMITEIQGIVFDELFNEW